MTTPTHPRRSWFAVWRWKWWVWAMIALMVLVGYVLSPPVTVYSSLKMA